jgi:hypothetical protein
MITSGNETIKKSNEYVWASVFVNHINLHYGFDYEVVPEPEEATPVDMRAVSLSLQYPALDLQLTYALETPFVAFPQIASDFSKEPTLAAIDKKLEHYRKIGTATEKLILLVQGYMSKTAGKRAFSHPALKRYAHYPFKGIYYVSPPMVSGETNESIQQGFVYTIKDAFEN